MTHEELVDRATDLASALIRLESIHQWVLDDEPTLRSVDVDVQSLVEHIAVAKENVDRALELLRTA